MNKCQNCKHWINEEDYKHSFCDLLSGEDEGYRDNLAYATSMNWEGVLYCKSDFGCVHFEMKPIITNK